MNVSHAHTAPVYRHHRLGRVCFPFPSKYADRRYCAAVRQSLFLGRVYSALVKPELKVIPQTLYIYNFDLHKAKVKVRHFGRWLRKTRLHKCELSSADGTFTHAKGDVCGMAVPESCSQYICRGEKAPVSVQSIIDLPLQTTRFDYSRHGQSRKH